MEGPLNLSRWKGTRTSFLSSPKMAASTSERTEQDSPPKTDQNATLEMGEMDENEQKQALSDSKQEPGDNNENGGVEMDVNGGYGAAEEEDEKPGPGAVKETLSPTENGNNDGETGREQCEPGESPERGSPGSSTDPAESSRVLKQEQREESVSSPGMKETKGEDNSSTEKTDHGIKRRASVEISSSDGEPLSRMDSEDRYVVVDLALAINQLKVDQAVVLD